MPGTFHRATMLPALPIALGLVLAPVLVPVRHAAAQTYSLTILGTLRADGTGNSTARGINDAGVVVGQAAADTGGLHAFRWSAPAGGPGIMADLGRLVVPFETMAQDINTSGSITGFGLTRPEGFGSGFRYAGAPPLVNLRETGGGGDSLAFGIADDGTIVGWSNLQQGCGNPDCMSNPGHAIVWPSGSVIPTRLPELGGYYSAATKISRDGATICGYGAIASGQTRAFRLRAGEGAAPLSPLPGDSHSYAYGVNDAGEVVGASRSAAGVSRAVLWIDTAAIDLGVPAGANGSLAQAINNQGLIVGYSILPGPVFDSRAVRFSRSESPVDLNARIPAGSGWTLIYADEINSAGQIVGNATNGTNYQAMLLNIACIADVDDGTGTGTPDGGVGIEDLLYYLVVYEAGISRADVDDGTGTGHPDGGVGIEDLLYYLLRFDAGC